MNRTLVLLAALALAGILIVGFRLGARHQVARTRYANWRAARRAVPVALKAFTEALVDVAGFWLLISGSCAVAIIVAWKIAA